MKRIFPERRERFALNEARELDRHRLMTVVPARVHDAVTHRNEGLPSGKMFPCHGLLDGKSVQFDANRHRLPGHPRIDFRHEPRIVAHLGHEGFRHTRKPREFFPLLRRLRIAPANELGMNELRPPDEAEAQAFENFRHAGRRKKLGPAGLRVLVNRATKKSQRRERRRILPSRKELHRRLAVGGKIRVGVVVRIDRVDRIGGAGRVDNGIRNTLRRSFRCCGFGRHGY